MTDTEKQIAGLKATLRKQKENNEQLRAALRSIAFFAEGLETQNTLLQMRLDRGCKAEEAILKAKIHQNSFLLESLEKIFAELENNS